jgi:hypothetical protein
VPYAHRCACASVAKSYLCVAIEVFVPFTRTSSFTRNSHLCLSSSHARPCPPFTHMRALHPTELTLVRGFFFCSSRHNPSHALRPTSEFLASRNGSAFVAADTGVVPAGDGGAWGGGGRGARGSRRARM